MFRVARVASVDPSAPRVDETCSACRASYWFDDHFVDLASGREVLTVSQRVAGGCYAAELHPAVSLWLLHVVVDATGVRYGSRCARYDFR